MTSNCDIFRRWKKIKPDSLRVFDMFLSIIWGGACTLMADPTLEAALALGGGDAGGGGTDISRLSSNSLANLVSSIAKQ